LNHLVGGGEQRFRPSLSSRVTTNTRNMSVDEPPSPSLPMGSPSPFLVEQSEVGHNAALSVFS
jgi:hypothetical protein